MNPEVIVRALAACADLCHRSNAFYCPICGGLGDGVDPAFHYPTCPWRMAREWVAAHTQETGGDPIGQPAGELQEHEDPGHL